MNHRIKAFGALKEQIERVVVTNVDQVERNAFSSDLLHTLQSNDSAILEIVEYGHLVPRVQQLHHRVGANEARSSRDQNVPLAAFRHRDIEVGVF